MEHLKILVTKLFKKKSLLFLKVKKKQTDLLSRPKKMAYSHMTQPTILYESGFDSEYLKRKDPEGLEQVVLPTPKTQKEIEGSKRR